MNYLMWEVWPRSNSRSIQYSKRDMVAALQNAGCGINDTQFMLIVKRELTNKEDPKTVRELVTKAIKSVHPKAPRKFIGLFKT